MDYLFAGIADFNEDLSCWDTSGVTSMRFMFEDAKLFDGNITTWDVSNVESMEGMFENEIIINKFHAEMFLFSKECLRALKNLTVIYHHGMYHP